MKAALFTTGPYIDMSVSARTVMVPNLERDDGGEEIVTWRVPLGLGAIPHVALMDCGVYVRWLLENQTRANGLDLQVAISHVGYGELAAAFEKVTGAKARYVDITLEEWWATGPMAGRANLPAGTVKWLTGIVGYLTITGYNADVKDAATMNIKQNFLGSWNSWRASGGNCGVITRNYGMLDEIFPGRVKSAEDWFRRETKRIEDAGEGNLLSKTKLAARGKGEMVLKLSEDKRMGKL